MFTTLTALLMVIFLIVGYFLGSPILFLGMGLVIAAITNLVSYEYADRFVLWSTHTKLIKESDNPTLYRIVRRVAQTASVPMPRVGIVQSVQPNAFATGKNPEKAIVVATTGILQVLTPSELEAVIGHEMSHVTHRDLLVGAVAATIGGTISFVSQMFLWNGMFGGFGNSRGRNQDNGMFLIIAIIAAILVPFAAMLVQLGLSRSRETLADEGGARLTRKPQELINALRKISNRANAKQWTQQNAPSPATASLWFVNPLKGSSWSELFSTHPRLEKRVAAIQKVAQDMGMIVS